MDDRTPGALATRSRRPILAVICGLPAAGKSTLAGHLHDVLGWPLFGKDEFKELLFDAGSFDPGTFTRAQSMVIGSQALAILFRVTRHTLEAGHNCMIEANFLPHLAPADFAPPMALADTRQVHCTIPDDLVLARYRERAEAGQRHPVHTDVEAGNELAARIKAGAGSPLPLDAPLVQVNTADGYQPDFRKILAFLDQ